MIQEPHPVEVVSLPLEPIETGPEVSNTWHLGVLTVKRYTYDGRPFVCHRPESVPDYKALARVPRGQVSGIVERKLRTQVQRFADSQQAFWRGFEPQLSIGQLYTD